MNMDDFVLVSVDDHLVEPPDMFEGHIPAKYKDDVPKLITSEDGTDAWVFEGQEATNVGLNAVAGRPPDEYGAEPTKFSEIRDGLLQHPRAHSGHERQRRRRVDELPVLPAVLRPVLRPGTGQGPRAGGAARLQRLARRRVVRHLSGPDDPAGAPADLGSAADGRRGAARGQEGLPRGHVLGEPREARLPVAAQRALGSVLAGLQ